MRPTTSFTILSLVKVGLYWLMPLLNILSLFYLNKLIEKVDIESLGKSYVHSQIISCYIVFFVFLSCIISLENFLLPMVTYTSNINMAELKAILKNFVLIQAFFNGFFVGISTRSKLINCVRHSAVMLLIGLLATFFLS